jgi:prophage regulatory protein
MPSTPVKRIIRREKLRELIDPPLSDRQINRLIDEGEFPKPIPLGLRTVGWLEDEIVEWQKERIRRRDRGERRASPNPRARRAKGGPAGAAPGSRIGHNGGPPLDDRALEDPRFSAAAPF